ncbi:dTMP kinase [Candidatus Nomurabacteria bacterium RIFCSPHIGHO2_01_FULL_39_220]|uniref:Thymidylate kinase n=1 Tax=Candidatus Nomurabacteria bacterium RIFCSPLOWO2_02_FULL_40_67 TaxID=1801787 RepID=A0A1F6Y491_9BACT|nr:MAG: Thymidylate kinase [Parcubacteria group bacterium GW2011_GWA2_40_37]KKS11671.1 MAG: Thymidylate kinase [Parcubacteria group bacterium GW2011_GWB1_41_5]KKS73435.1 MAG: Thymidylate kinase [Parcubacteria group bacterium GW2011_GWF2_42_7]OGI62071.1 MAG: dTMP kinase [Candidatus Nomurabacteria bacterium RBG_16_40_11]OGI70286.1 MAG: dTMP kinase [Candidatus Nomurabacteria bacterium RIFCSPHIGHO2_01_FULL_39_220]OGI73489.1 MAG: dTMP kinase [Candidatus Nomurabacteria bacterium RIFCSPHIGHO2_02_41_1
MVKKGKLIVIDGTDGSGKTTQANLLVKHLRKDGRKVKFIHFPRYEDNFFGKFIAHCLSEQYYNWVNIHPKIASVIYAADRFESKEKIQGWLKQGYTVVMDRYISSNQIHQGGKIANLKKREAFIKWLAQMEYEVLKIPAPNLTIYLSLPVQMVLKLIRDRNYKGARAYLGSKKDVHEKDKNFLKNSIKSALWLTRTQKNWIKIECMKGSKLRSFPDIHEEIYEKVKKVLK